MLSKEEITANKQVKLAQRAAQTERTRERLMLDYPPEERVTLMLQRWLNENQEELWQVSEELERAARVMDDWLANNP